MTYVNSLCRLYSFAMPSTVQIFSTIYYDSAVVFTSILFSQVIDRQRCLSLSVVDTDWILISLTIYINSLHRFYTFTLD